MITKSFDLQVGGTATVKLQPVTASGAPASVENVDFQSSDAANCPIVVDITSPTTFHIGPLVSAVDVDFVLNCDGHVGEGVTPITDTLHCHGVTPDAVDVQFNVTVDPVAVAPVPVPLPVTTIDTTTNADGSVTVTMSDGSTTTTATDGTVSTTPPTVTAVSTVANADGSVTTTFSDGSTATRSTSGIITTTPPTGAAKPAFTRKGK